MFPRFIPRPILSQLASRRQPYHSEALDKWIKTPPTITLTDSFHYEPLSDLYITLPTRDGTRKPYAKPQVGQPVPYGAQLAFFHARKPEHLLRADGTDEEISPPAPFTRRMWAGGKMTWNNDNRMLVGSKVHANATVGNVKLKGVEKGKPMIFVTQRIEYEKDGSKGNPSLVEERSHVYFEVKNEEEGKKPGPKCEQGLLTSMFSW
jgi:sphingosine kinase